MNKELDNQHARSCRIACLPPDGWDIYEAERRGYTAEQFNSWPFLGYDDCGDEVRRPPVPGNWHSAAGTWRNKRTGGMRTVREVGYCRCEAWVWFADKSGCAQAELYRDWDRVQKSVVSTDDIRLLDVVSYP